MEHLLGFLFELIMSMIIDIVPESFRSLVILCILALVAMGAGGLAWLAFRH